MRPLHIGRSFGLSILAGLVASGVLVGINVALVQPYTAALAEIELENLLAMGEFDEEEFQKTVTKGRLAWRSVKNATKWVEEMRGSSA